MTITYDTKAIRREGNEIIVFIEFSNGEVYTNRFPVTATVIDIANWADSQVALFEQREREAEENIKRLEEELIGGNTE